MILPYLIFNILGPHEVQLLPILIINQRIDKQIQIIDLTYLIHKLFNIGDKLCWIDIVHQIKINFVLSQRFKCLSVFEVLDVFNRLF